MKSASRSNTRDSVLARLMEDYLASCEKGQPLSAEELAVRYPELADQVADCLASLDFIRRAAVAPTSDLRPPTSDSRLPTPDSGLLGDFRILREVGRGGMGVVYEAEQISLARRVALKVLPFASVLDPKQLARFKNEALAAASLDHPHIVDVLGVGSDRGTHFYAMRFIDGCTLADVIEALRAGSRESGVGNREGEAREGEAPAEPSAATPHSELRIPHSTRAVLTTLGITETSRRTPDYYRKIAALIADAADALHHAHEQGVIHRDIKPSNLMLDNRGKLWITDLGLAHIESGGTLTMTGDLMGTLRYMSPEQATGSRLGIDHRTDVYSLGVTLYELLTLRPVFAGENRADLLRQIAHDDPIAPRKHDKSIPADTETIVLKALAKEPADRYTTAVDLATDLRRFGSGEPVRARRIGPVQQLQRLTRRHWPIVVAFSAIIAMVAIAAGVSYAFVASAQRQRAVEAELHAMQLSYASDIPLAYRACATFDFPRAVELLERYRPAANGFDIRGYEWHLPWRTSHNLVQELPMHGSAANSCSFSADNRLLAVACGDTTVRLWDVGTRQELRCLRGHAASVNGSAFSPNSPYLVTASDDGTLKLWNSTTWEIEHTLDDREEPYRRVAFSPNGRWLVASGNQEISVWNVLSRERVGTVPGRVFAVSPENDHLATGHGQKLWYFELPTLRELVKVVDPPGEVCSLIYVWWGEGLWVGMHDGYIRNWTVPEGLEHPYQVRDHADRVNSIARSPDGRTFASAGSDRKVTVWTAGNMRARARIEGFAGRVSCVDYSPDGRLLAACDDQGTVKLYGKELEEHGRVLFRGDHPINALDVSPAGDALALGGGGRIYIVSPDGNLVVEDDSHARDPALLGDFWGIDYSSSGRFLASGGYDGMVRLWSIPPLDQHAVHNARGRLARVRFDPTGTMLGWCCGHGCTLGDARTGKILATTRSLEGFALDFVPGQKQVLIGLANGSLVLTDLEFQNQRTLPIQCGDTITTAIFASDGRHVAVTSKDGTALLIDAQMWTEKYQLIAQPTPIWSAGFSPDGKTLATAGEDAVVRLWHVATGRELITLDHGRNAIVYCVAFSPDGKRLYTAGKSCDNRGELRVWSAEITESAAKVAPPSS